MGNSGQSGLAITSSPSEYFGTMTCLKLKQNDNGGDGRVLDYMALGGSVVR